MAQLEQTSSMDSQARALPIPISKIAGHYYVTSAEVIAWLRSQYNIPGVLVGTLPQSPQQNVFHGLPLRLIPEEARYLVEEGVAYVVDEYERHKQGLVALERGTDGTSASGSPLSISKAQWMQCLQSVGQHIADDSEQRKQAERDRALGQVKVNEVNRKREARRAAQGHQTNVVANMSEHNGEAIFSAPPLSPQASQSSSQPREVYHITPTTSYPPLKACPPPLRLPQSDLPPVPSTYPLYLHLHQHGYFLSPGLRFGCNYLAYPGDPLRFHSHFLVVGKEWDEKFEVLTLVGGGRLGTGVKKGFLVGGIEPPKTSPQNSEGYDQGDGAHDIKSTPDETQNTESREDNDDHDHDHDHESDARTQGRVRTFCIEWSGM